MIFTPVILAVLTTAAELSTALQKGVVGAEFDLNATVFSECRADDRDFAVEDKTGAVIVSPPRSITNAEKRGKALANEELERLESDLKVCERTRPAGGRQGEALIAFPIAI